jgi:hypothetical protein
MRFHIAILWQPYLDLIFAGKKKKELRLLKVQCAPYHGTFKGDPLWLKESGGLMLGEAVAGEVIKFYDLTPAKIKALTTEYADDLQIQPGFLTDSKLESKYAVVIDLEQVQKYVTPRPFKQNGRSAWIDKDDSIQSLDFFQSKPSQVNQS